MMVAASQQARDAGGTSATGGAYMVASLTAFIIYIAALATSIVAAVGSE